MAWTTEDRRRYALAIQEMVRQGMLVRLAATINAIGPPSRIGRPRVWPALTMLQALWHMARDDRAWRRLPPGSPPHQTVWSRLMGWQRRTVRDRAFHAGHLPPRRGRAQAPANGGGRRHAERPDPAPARPTRLRRQQEGQRQEARAHGRHAGRPARRAGGLGRPAGS